MGIVSLDNIYNMILGILQGKPQVPKGIVG